MSRQLMCDFCEETKGDDIILLEGKGNVHICEDCLSLSVETVQQTKAQRAKQEAQQDDQLSFPLDGMGHD